MNLDLVQRLHLEAVVAKRRDSRYEPGKRTGAWVKVKFSPRQEFVVGGFKPNDADFDSLLVGYYDDGKLRFAGKVRAGFPPQPIGACPARLHGVRHQSGDRLKCSSEARERHPVAMQ
jgi:ATP-dependent DNA ligase